MTYVYKPLSQSAQTDSNLPASNWIRVCTLYPGSYDDKICVSFQLYEIVIVRYIQVVYRSLSNTEHRTQLLHGKLCRTSGALKMTHVLSACWRKTR